MDLIHNHNNLYDWTNNPDFDDEWYEEMKRGWEEVKEILRRGK